TANPQSTGARFVLAYHYLTQGYTDQAVAQLKQVVAIAPQDTLSAQLIKQFSPASTAAATETLAAPAASTPAPAATPVKEGSLTGNGNARPAADTSIDLRIGDDGSFNWKVTAKGKPKELTGKYSLADDLLTLAQGGEGGSGGALVGRVAWQADNKWSFRVLGAGPEDQGLVFTR